MTALKPGSYKLGRTITNPKPDRRQKYDWRKWETWPEGMTLVIADGALPLPGLPKVEVLKISRLGGHDDFLLESEAGQLLAPHLLPMEEQPSDWLRREFSSGAAPSILDYLVRTGKLTDADVRAAYEACCVEDAKEG